ncbi:MAG: phosphoglycerate kinase [Spirochaetia bacterium]|nr:phosphoglycerate kinase [Spirochaetia bacterium]
MNLRTVKDLDLQGKKVLIRVDFNVPLKEGVVTDTTRIESALPTIRYILEQEGTSLIVMTHLGRPKGVFDSTYSLSPVAVKFSELIGREVIMAPDCIGKEVQKLAEGLKPGQILLLENVRFHKEETENDSEFSEELASLGDVYINDAFGTAHRAHASTEGITKYLPSAAGFLIEKETKFFAPLLDSPDKPFVAIIGGAKVSSKIGVLESLLKTCDTLIIGGGMSFTFLTVLGKSIGNSLFEEDYLETAEKLLEKAKAVGVEIVLPVDHIAANTFSEDAEAVLIDDMNIPEGMLGLDIGPKTLEKIGIILEKAASIIWNGPMGVFEFEKFSKGTIAVAEMVASCKGTTVVGGGDSVAAVNKFGFSNRIDHVSTGGGASLEFLEGKVLPGLAALQK